MSIVLSEVNDVRQSSEWDTYLNQFGWISLRTSRGISVRMRKSIVGGLVKIQKPKPFVKNDLEEIVKTCESNGAGLIKIEPYVGQDVTIMEDYGFVKSYSPMTPISTYLIDLTLSEAELWEKLSHSAKYSINRAMREETKVEIIANPSDAKLEQFYTILKSTGKRKKFFVPPYKYTNELAKAFGQNGYLIFAYDKNDEITAAKWHVGSSGIVLYVSGGITNLGRKDKSGYALVWKSILHFKSLGYKVFDLEGKYDVRFPHLTKHWGGFSDFKEKFGGIAVEFSLPYVLYLNPVLKFLHKTVGFNL